MLRTDQVAQLPHRIGAVPEVPEFLCAVECGRIPYNVVMDVFAIHMGTDKEGVSAFQEPFGKFIPDLIRFFRCHFTRLERLTYLISNHIIFLFTPGTDSVLPLG